MAKPIKAPIKGMPMPMGKRPAPPPFPIQHPAQMQAPQAPQMQAPQAAPGFASGTPDVMNGSQTTYSPFVVSRVKGPTMPNGRLGEPPLAVNPDDAAASTTPDATPTRGTGYIPRYETMGVPTDWHNTYSTGMQTPHFAQGTPNVPAPGQTVTNGSWNPQEAPPPTPMSPSPLGGQNQNLRQSLGMGVKRFAEGTSDVGGPNVGAGGGQPAQGYDAQTASYSGLDQHFVAHLRAAIGLAPKEQGFAGGTPNVGFDLGGAPGITNPTTVTPADRVISGQLGPVSWGQQAVANKTGAPANPGGQPGGTVPDNPNDFTTRAADQQIDPTGGGAPANPQGQPGGSLPGRPALGGGFQQAGANDPMFGSVLQALVGQPQTTTSTNKQITDPNLNHTVTQLSGANPDHVDAMLNPHEYTREQFQAAVADMPWGMAKSLWAMQHYLNPTQRAQGQYFGQLDQGVLNAQNADKGSTKASLEAYSKKLQNALDARTGARKKVTEPQSYYGADQSITNDSQGG